MAGALLLGGDSFYMFEQSLPPAFWFLTVAALINAATTFDERRGQPAWGLQALLLVLVVFVSVGVVMIRTAPTPEGSTSRSPDGRLTAALTDAGAVDRSAWELRVQQNSGLFSRQWYVGCIHDGGRSGTPTNITWVSNITFEVRTQAGAPARVRVDTSGRPISHGSLDASCR